jgi:hypothetical protein
LIAHHVLPFRVCLAILLQITRRLRDFAAIVYSAAVHRPNDLRPIVATEFVGTSISAYGPPYDIITQALAENPHVHFFESRRRGYVCADLKRAHMLTRVRVVSDVRDPKADVSTLRTFCGRRRQAGSGGGLAFPSASLLIGNGGRLLLLPRGHTPSLEPLAPCLLPS